MTMLKSTIGIVGDSDDFMIKDVKQIHDKLRIENNRHALLVKSQTSLQVMYLFNHVDNGQHLALEYAKQAILDILPTWIGMMFFHKFKIKLDELLSLL